MHLLELLAGSLHVEAAIVEPGVALELRDSVSVFAIVSEQLENHVLEVFGEAGSVDFLEVGFYLTGQKEVVEVLLLAGLLEGENSLYDNKYDNSHAEKVNLGAVVSLAFLDFGGHVSHGASVGLEVVNAFVASETEIGDFQIQLVINENVLELEVTMDAPEVVHVLKSVKHLSHKEAACVLAHGSHGLAQVEEETAGDVLHHDEDQVADNAARGLDDLAGISEIHHSDDSCVLEVLENRDFVLNGENGVFVASQELLLENFDGNLDVRVALLLGEVNLGGVAFAETLEDLVLAVEDRVL